MILEILDKLKDWKGRIRIDEVVYDSVEEAMRVVLPETVPKTIMLYRQEVNSEER